MILIVTNKQDTHADEVIRRLDPGQAFRLNTEDLIDRYVPEVGIDEYGRWYGTIRDECGRILDLPLVRVAWFRKPNLDFSVEQEVESEALALLTAEARAFIDLLYSIPSITWVNDPFVGSKAKVKFQQLILAAQYGVKVPKTLITTNVEHAKRFFRDCGGSILTKAIYTSNVTVGGINQGIPSQKLGPKEFYQTCDGIELCPTLLQEYVEKQFEIRVTVIGDKVFPVRIDSQLHDETKVDWRIHTELNPHSDYVLSRGIQDFCVEFVRLQGLLFGAMDFIVTPDGEVVLLENNPFGQYLWLELETGVNLTEEMCGLLVRLDQSSCPHRSVSWSYGMHRNECEECGYVLEADELAQRSRGAD